MPYLWVPPAATKGRLLVADGTTWQPLTVGADGQVLTADSAQSTGVKWGTPSGGGGGDFTLISELDLTSTQTFSAISGSYSDLRLHLIGRSTASATGVVVDLRFNGDTGSNYVHNRISQNGSTVSGQEGLSQTSARIGAVTGANAPTAAPGFSVVDIIGYAGTSFHKPIKFDTSNAQNYATTAMFSQRGSSWWRNTSAITSIAIVLGSGSWASGSTARLYGLG